MTGANGSSVSIFESSDRPRRTVGSKKYPLSNRSDFFPPVSTLAPFPVASPIRPAVFSIAFFSNIGPTTTPLSRPLPSFSAFASSTAASVNFFWMSSWTKNRLGLMQTWPLFRNLPRTAALATASGSASGKTMNGACPPSSRLSRLTWSAAARISCLPTSVDPVKLTLRTAGLVMNSSAISAAGPMTRLATPAGQARVSRHSNTPIRQSGVWLAGLQTIVHPAARAGASFRACKVIGKFHGPIAPTTPTGCLMTMCRLPAAAGGMICP